MNNMGAVEQQRPNIDNDNEIEMIHDRTYQTFQTENTQNKHDPATNIP